MQIHRGVLPSFVHAGLLLACVSLTGCGEEAPIGPTGPTTTEVLTPNAPPLPGQTECRVVKTTNIPIEAAQHLDDCTPVTYETNPPSGGNHWGKWAAFKKYTQVVPREMYVHSMEHGAVVLAYRCEGECPEVVAALEKVFDEATGDPLCVTQGSGPKTRLIITEDPELDTPIAASAWGATYTATCIDTASLAAFVAQMHAKGPENICYPGVDIEAGGGPMCGGI